MTQPKVVVFTCNWNAYSGMEAAGVDHLTIRHRPARSRYVPGPTQLASFSGPGKGANGVLCWAVRPASTVNSATATRGHLLPRPKPGDLAWLR
jgi:hypothetical protein